MNYQELPWAWYYRQLSCTRKKRDVLLKNNEAIAGQPRTTNCQGLSVVGPVTVPTKAPASRTEQAQPESSPQLLGPGKGCICEVTAASEKWGQGWRQGQAVITAFLPRFSLAAENWQSQLFLFSLALSCGFAYAAEQAGASFVGFSSCENMICCPRINFEKAQLLEWEFCLMVGKKIKGFSSF